MSSIAKKVVEFILLTGVSISFSAAVFSFVSNAGILNGPDGDRWLAPLLTSLSVSSAVFFAHSLIRGKSLLTWESLLIAGIFITGTLILFISVQRFSSGVHYTEGFNETIAMRLSQGHSIYPDPEKAPTGTLYSPLWFVITALFYTLFPDGSGFGRIISTLAFMGTGATVFYTAQFIFKNRNTSLLAVLLFLSTYAPMLKLYDAGFVDTLLMLFGMLTIQFFIKNTPQDDLLALIFSLCAVYTKQTGIFYVVVVVVTMILKKRNYKFFLPLGAAALIFTILILATHGWILYYLRLPSLHPFHLLPPSNALYRTSVLLLPIWTGYLFYFFTTKNKRFIVLSLIIIGASFAGLFKTGGWIQAVYPLIPIIATASAGFLIRIWPLALCQIVIGLYNPFSTFYPYAQYRNGDLEIIDYIKNNTGEIWLPTETYLCKKTGIPEWDNLPALFGPDWAGQPPPRRITRKIVNRDFSAILYRKNSTDHVNLFPYDIRSALKQNYKADTLNSIIVLTPISDTTATRAAQENP